MKSSQCVTALGDTKYGVIMIPIVLSFSRTLAFIASYLDRNASILKSQQSNLPSSDESASSGGKVSFLEDTANVLRDAFIKCLAGSPGVQRTTRPNNDDKRIGIYLTANATLKLLFQARKLRNAQQMFLSIDAQSPPLSFYPAAQRVTYLYYLGRYHFANNHFLRAATVLHSAYEQCHSQARTHRRLILIYLIASNLCLGNFASQKLLIRPDASALGKHFLPLIRIIRSGDIGSFESYLSLTSSTSQWFLRRRILLQLRNRCEILVWRSLIRKCFVLVGYKGEDRKTPFLRLNVVRHAARFSIARANILNIETNGSDDVSVSDANYIDPEYLNILAAQKETGFDLTSGQYIDLTQHDTTNHFPPSSSLPEAEQSPTTSEIESICLSLIQQGFLRGFISRPTSGIGSRFAIKGSKTGGGPVIAGFPNVYATIVGASEDEGSVPGWVRVGEGGGGGSVQAGLGGSLAGRVINLSGARPVGAV